MFTELPRQRVHLRQCPREMRAHRFQNVLRLLQRVLPGFVAVTQPGCGTAWKIDPSMECAPRGGQIGRFELTPLAGLPEDGSHDEASITQRRLQAAGR